MKSIYGRLTLSIALLCLVSLLGWQVSASQVEAQRQTDGVEASLVEARPSRLRITLGVETEAASADEALRQNNAQIEALVKALVEAGIAAENIQTQSAHLTVQYAGQPMPFQEEMAWPEITGYAAINTLRINGEYPEPMGELSSPWTPAVTVSSTRR